MSDEAKHTPEPWFAGNPNIAGPKTYQIWAVENRCVDESGGSLPGLQLVAHCNANGEMVPGIDEANGARIVACVNACAGIPTEQLEAGCVGKLVEEANALLLTLEQYAPDKNPWYRAEFPQMEALAAALAPFQKD